MAKPEKACPIVTRTSNGALEVLAFDHPTAGKQFVKGTIEKNESPRAAAVRELREESGLMAITDIVSVGSRRIGQQGQNWHFFVLPFIGLPNTWQHQTKDDFGHVFVFFWHPLAKPLNDAWHPDYHEAFNFFSERVREA